MKFDLILRWETGGRAVMAVAHLGHAEIRVTDLERSRWFFTEVLCLYVSEENYERIFLRAWQDWDHHTLILKKSDHTGVEHFGWRVEGPEDMGAYEKRLKELGIDYHWIEGGEEPGQGDGLRFLTPGGFPYELYWERELFTPKEGGPEGDGLVSALPSHPQKYAYRGIGPRRFDHVNVLTNVVALTDKPLPRDRHHEQQEPERPALAPRRLLPRFARPGGPGRDHPSRQRH